MISVIVPTLNEARNLPRLLSDLSRQESPSEILVVDGGSEDDTVVLARGHGAEVIQSTPGRGLQLRRGAEVATGEILLFLHADSRFPSGGLARIEAVLAASPQTVGGNFRLLFDSDSGFSRWLTGFYAWLRSHGIYYGDSGVFVRREAYRALGGLRSIALMEDYDFTRRLERFGKTCCIEDPPLVTSSRRFQGRHPIPIVCGWLAIHALFHLGVSTERLARMYDSARRRDRQGSCAPPR